MAYSGLIQPLLNIINMKQLYSNCYSLAEFTPEHAVFIIVQNAEP